MTKTISTEIIIDAMPEQIWNILTDFPQFITWNPFIKSISGNANLGEKLTVYITPPGGSKMKFSPQIIELVPGEKLIWKGKLLIPGLFDGQHKFILEKAGDATRFIHEEVFSGILVHLLPNSIYKQTEAGFNEMNAALKKRCE